MSVQHTLLAKFIHWTFIPLYVYGIIKQVNDISELEDSELLILEVIFATVFLLIVILRFTYMRRFKTFQGAEEHIHIVHYYFARIVHRAMYACLILLPLTGLIIAGLYNQGYTDEEQTILDLPLVLHAAAADLSYALIALHISAAIYSRIKGEGVWSSMVPIIKESGSTDNEIVKKIAGFENTIYEKISNLISSNDSD
ncbi:MAG: cytochrome b/b6 domain-containing protein [Candidatus Poseidoniales archaeon]|nr:MAG: cytochrome b/b6 domain-containing protein [Candidatus Poseidoniales archaeon]